MTIDRRRLLHAGLASVLASGVARPVMAKAADRTASRDGVLAIARKLAAENAPRIGADDVVGVVNYAAPSWQPRFHLVDMAKETVSSFLVSHGRGSDPGHTGWLQRFSNTVGSNASSHGAYRAGELYSGKHGRSMRLTGLDNENSNAEARAIVVHAAWYVSDEMLNQHGKLGRSEGCFALSDAGLGEVLERLGPGRLLYAGRF